MALATTEVPNASASRTLSESPSNCVGRRKIVERLITQARRGDLHSRRLIASYLLDPRVVKKLCEQIAPALKDRSGGYTRITKSRIRRGDAAELSVLELVK